MNEISSKADEPTHLDLFSGIGGFALAAGWAGFKTIGFCDNEPYAQAVLKKHWPDVPIHGDIKTLDGTAYRGVTLLTGGFPCQPFSNAGKQRGKDDDRYLWPEMLRIIQEARPTWIVGENVAGIINLALDQVCADLECEGYEVEPIIILACGVDAQHKRDRVWILANSEQNGQPCTTNGRCSSKASSEESSRKNHTFNPSRASSLPSTRKDVANPQSEQGSSNDYRGEQRKISQSKQGQFGGSDCWELREGDWATEPRLGRVANGIPNRVDRLKGLGNAIVPQVAYQILKSIRSV